MRRAPDVIRDMLWENPKGERMMRHSVLARVLATAASAGASVAPAGEQGPGGFAAPTKKPSELRAMAAETTAAKVKDPN
jgi:hypothetical protein